MNQNNTEPEPMETEASDCNCSEDHENNNMEEANRLRKKRTKCIGEEERRKTIAASGKRFINVFQKLLQETKAEKMEMYLYMQRVLHAIFFFGHINHPQTEPKEFIATKSWDEFKKKFQKPLQEYKTHLPSQTPYSILLEYITNSYDGNQKHILEELKKWNKELLVNVYDDEGNRVTSEEFALSASVITHSYVNDPDTDNARRTAYGSSIAYKGSVPRRIMIAISALFVWDKVISYEVSCGEGGRGIRFPNYVHCNSYRFETTCYQYEPIAPCAKCNKMFIVTSDPKYEKTNKKEDWRHGNCAETESLNNLICCNKNVQNALFTYDDNGESMKREIIIKRFKDEHEGKLQKELKNLLASRGFKGTQNSWALFTPAEYVQC